MKNTIDILKANRSDTSFVWQDDAQEHMASWPWMKYSAQIAIKVRKRMKELNMTQSSLAGKIGCTQQYVSLLLKGKENLTLETISKLESSLDVQIISIPSMSVRGYGNYAEHKEYLSDVETTSCGKKNEK